ncbi:MAG: hypothetical protein EI684_13615 [Candidatus Viridilinea halotolerans]|uniref:Uncharacterized protein n=1 Tax=Candidatus Viridilinea halotolerans TaxID=2491704 RepID=A0A426TX71_9CHLR|nr:MAG: hypothetical protein EI684_13615 [Candidatus Viridilinea halotolerans]
MHSESPAPASQALCVALQRIIAATGLTVAEVSRQLGCAAATPLDQRLSTGQPAFSRDEIERLAQILQVSAADRVELLRLCAGEANPFIVGNAVPPERFYGRDTQRQTIRHRIGGMVPQSISLIGFRRSGKSSLLNYIHECADAFCGKEQRPLVVPCSLAQSRMQTPGALYEHLRRVIERKTGSSPWRQEENGDPYALDDSLEALRDRGYRLIVLLDEFESLQRRLAAFGDWGNDWRERAGVEGHFALVIASVRPLEEIYQPLGLTSPFGNIFTTAELGPFETATWQQLVRDGFAQSGTSLSDHDFTLLDELAGGLPYYTQLAAYLLWSYRDQQRVRAEFALQAAPRFQELWDDLQPNERAALRHAAGLPGSAAPAPGLLARMQRHGLLRADGRVFSAALAEWMRDS